MRETLYEKLKKGEPIIGICNMIPLASIVNLIMGYGAEWDFIWIDEQHSLHDFNSITSTLEVCSSHNVYSILRPVSNEYGHLVRCMDLAPGAIMLPMINNETDIKNSLNAILFPPYGKRSYGGRRIIDLHGRNYYKEKISMVIAQIETEEGYNNCEKIINTNGVDMLFIGPSDLKIDMGIDLSESPYKNKRLVKIMQSVGKVCKEAGKFAGCIAANPNQLNLAIEMGYQMIVCGADNSLVEKGSLKAYRSFKYILNKDNECISDKAITIK